MNIFFKLILSFLFLFAVNSIYANACTQLQNTVWQTTSEQNVPQLKNFQIHFTQVICKTTSCNLAGYFVASNGKDQLLPLSIPLAKSSTCFLYGQGPAITLYIVSNNLVLQLQSTQIKENSISYTGSVATPPAFVYQQVNGILRKE